MKFRLRGCGWQLAIGIAVWVLIYVALRVVAK